MAVEKGVDWSLRATDGFSGTFAKLAQAVSGAESSFGRLQGLIATFTGAGVTAAAAAMIKASEEAMQAQRRLEAVLRATGNSTGYTVQQLSSLADALERNSRFDGEQFKEATAVLVRFGNIGGQNLERVLRLAGDYAALTGGDLASAAETLGRALNNPAEGVARLERGFGDLSKETVTQIKLQQEMGNQSGALATAIEALEKKIGGADQATNTGLTGAMRGLNKAMGDVMEAMGGMADNSVVVSILDQLTDRLRGIKAVLEGDWTDKLLVVVGAMMGRTGLMLGALGGRKPEMPPAPAGSGTFDFSGIDDGFGSRGDANLRVMLERRREDERRRQEWLQNEARMRDLDAAGWVAYAEAVFKEADELNLAMAKLSEDHWANEDKLRDEDIKGWVAYAEEVFKEADELNLAIARANEQATRDEEERWSGFLNGADSAFRTGWDAFTGGAKDAGAIARDALKRTLFDWLYTALAKPFVLNIVASLAGFTGLTGLSNAAGNAGGGWLGLGSNLMGVGSAIGSILPGGAIGTAFGNIAQMGAGMLGLSGSVGSMIGSVASFLPGIGTAIAVAAMLYQAFNDGPENPNLRIFQGQGGSGLFGGIRTEGNYSWDNTGINAYIGGLDARLARILGPTGTAAATAGLSAYTQAGLRSDGQPAQFAFPEGDATAAEQLAREVLQSRYGIIFQQIDSTIAETIRTWSGTSTELQTYIETALGIVEGLAEMGVTGLNITTLQLMQREGETLAQTFQRVAGTWSWFNENFYTEAERLEMATTQVTGVFAELGLEIPGSVTEFRKLVEGLDLSTEEGRRMWDMLMGVAPAFLTVTNAAGEATTATDDLSEALLRQAEIQRQIEESVRNSRESQLAAIVGARGGLADFLNRTNLSDLSPLTPQERLAEARKQYEAVLAAAMSGDLGAAGRLGGVAENYLQIAREMFASGSGYISIYDQVMGQVKGVDQRLAIDEQMLRATLGMATDIAAQTEILIEVKSLLIDIRDKAPAVVAADTKPR